MIHLTTRQIQERLIDHGHDPGPVDGAMGRRTRDAVRAFQRAIGLEMQWYGTVGERTARALLRSPGNTRPLPILEADRSLALPPWYQELRRRMGLHERRDRTALMAWLRSDGKTLGDPAVLPWCGDAVATAIALTLPSEALPTNPYLARNWLKFGVARNTPAVGAIGVAWRGSPGGTSGHVFFAVGRDGRGNIRALGGNQSDAITDAALIAPDRILGWRWPATYPPPAGSGLPLVTGGAISHNEA